jgi:hypothetical protein
LIFLLVSRNSLFAHTKALSLQDIDDVIFFFFGGSILNIGRSISLIDSPGKSIKALYLVIISLLAIASMCIVFWKCGNKLKIIRKSMLFFVIQYFFIFIFLSISRVKFGFSGSFSSRYMYFYITCLIVCSLVIGEYLIHTKNRQKYLKPGIFSMCAFFITISLYRARRYVYSVEERNQYNINEICKSYGNEEYVADYSRLHPYLSDEDIINTTRRLSVYFRCSE